MANITQGWAKTRNKRKESTDIDYKSALAEHVATSNHVIDWDHVNVIEQEQHWTLCGIKETIHICTNPQSLNRPQEERRATRYLGLPLNITTAAETMAPPTSPGPG